MLTRKIELRRLYDETAERYDKRYEEIQGKKYQLVLKNVSKSDRILDIGCGTGMLLGELAKRCKLAVGVDSSQGMLKVAKGRVRDFSLACADADHLPFRESCFDTVVSVTLLQNMPDPKTTLKEMARVLRPGGKVIVTVLKHKCDRPKLEEWVRSAGLKLLESGEIEDSEDVFCIAVRG